MIPLARQDRLLKLVIGRLHDKSSNVRKQAVQLLTTLLQCNPFTASMPEEELKEELTKAREQLAKMEKESGILSEEQMEQQWADIEER